MYYYSKTTRGFYNTEIHGDNIQADAVEITDAYYNELFVGQSEGKEIVPDENGYPILVTPAPSPPQPIVVSPRQIRQALTRADLRTQVEAAVAAGDQDLKDWWSCATQFEENHPEVTAMATALGITEAQVHDLFTLAQTL